MFEHHSQPVLSQKRWVGRVVRSTWLAGLLVAFMLVVGVVGYHFIGGLPLVDAFLESSMILGGMGAIAPMINDEIKLFAAIYALLSGLVVVSTTAIILAPWLHRMLHHLHHNKQK